MSIIVGIAVKTFSIVLSVILLMLLGKFLEVSFRRGRVIWLPPLLYLPLSIFIDFRIGIYAGVLLLLCLGIIHLIAVVAVIFFRDRSRLFSISPDSIIDLVSFINDSAVVFYKKRAVSLSNKYVDTLSWTLLALRERTGSPVYGLMSLFCKNYKLNGYRPLPLIFENRFHLDVFNQLVEYYQRADVFEELIRQTILNRDTEGDEGSLTSERSQTLSRQLDVLNSMLNSIGRMSPIETDSALIVLAKDKIIEICTKLVYAFIPSNFLFITKNDNAGIVVEADITLNCSGQCLLIYKKLSNGQLPEPEPGNTLNSPQPSTIEIKVNFTVAGLISKYSQTLHYDYEEDFKIAKTNQVYYKSYIMSKMVKYSSGFLRSIFAENWETKAASEYDSRAEGIDKLTSKISDELKGEASTTLSDKLELLLSPSFLTGSVTAGLMDADLHAAKTTLDNVVNHALPEIDRFLFNLNQELDDFASETISSVASSIDLSFDLT